MPRIEVENLPRFPASASGSVIGRPDLPVTRRRTLVCAACLLWKSKSAMASTHTGCCLDGHQLDDLLATANSRFGSFLSMDRLIPFSGDPQFDRALGRQLVRLASAFSVRPGFAYADDFNDMNAAASPVTKVQDTRGTVAFGIRFLRQLLSRGDGGDIAVLGICAHEFAHIHQFFSDDRWLLSSVHRTAKLVELHADYLSGYFIGQFKRDRPRINLQTFGDFLFRAGNYEFNDPEFHGTPRERVRAAEEGFRVAAVQGSFAAAARSGRAFVLQYFR